MSCKIRIVELPACRMVTSGMNPEDPHHRRFEKMWNRLDAKRKDRFFPRDFMVHVGPPQTDPPEWWYAIEDWVSENDTAGFEIFDFEGGLFATANTYDGGVNILIEAHKNLNEWLAQHDKLMYNDRPGHHVMFHAFGPDKDIVGYQQMEYYFPIGLK